MSMCLRLNMSTYLLALTLMSVSKLMLLSMLMSTFMPIAVAIGAIAVSVDFPQPESL